MQVALPSIDEIRLINYHEQVDSILTEGIQIFSFTFGDLDPSTVQRFKSKGVTLIGTCISMAEAKAFEASGMDLLCVQGWEAEGHRGSFFNADLPQIGGLSLLTQVSEAVQIPLIYAGGIYNAKTLLTARTLGAQGFQVGSLLLESKESGLKAFEKERLRKVKEEEIVLTRSFSGRYARGIKNSFMEAVENTDLILPYPYQNKLTGELRKVAKAAQNTNFVSIWLAQSINGFSDRSTADILKELITQNDNSNLS